VGAIQHDRRCDDWPRPGTAPGLIDAGDDAGELVFDFVGGDRGHGTDACQ
jgi:hypothetical protein